MENKIAETCLNYDLEKYFHYQTVYHNIKNFKTDAQKHIKYLQIILFICMLYLLDIKFFDHIQFCCVTFIILFQLAFTQNMLNNLSQRIK